MRNNKQGREGPAIISGADSKKKKKKRDWPTFAPGRSLIMLGK